MKTDYRSYHLSLAETIGCFIVYFIFFSDNQFVVL